LYIAIPRIAVIFGFIAGGGTLLLCLEELDFTYCQGRVQGWLKKHAIVEHSNIMVAFEFGQGRLIGGTADMVQGSNPFISSQRKLEIVQTAATQFVV
jgi:hypothetical protein